MEESVKTYTRLNKLIGGWTDWVQGAGGNCSVKLRDGLSFLVKQSGTALADAKWIQCDTGRVLSAMNETNESLDAAVLSRSGESGNPSIETFFHCLPARIIVHLHPAPLLPTLCRSDLNTLRLPGYHTQVIGYAKPGIPLAKLLTESHQKNPETNVFFLKSHGVLLMGESIDAILDQMVQISYRLFPASYLRTNIPLCITLARELPTNTIIKSFFQGNGTTFRTFRPYTPDIAVFLQSAPLCLSGGNRCDHMRRLHAYREEYSTYPTIVLHESVCYVAAPSLQQCYGIYEILCIYPSTMGGSVSYLNSDQVHELVNWDKEKNRRSA
jgi:rhamnose utilization protein RhaD (predicted bifunctional aldolase and dehydrogenase)